jgi:hypothetical protein
MRHLAPGSEGMSNQVRLTREALNSICHTE